MDNVKGYTLLNSEKVERALNGNKVQNGAIVGGIAKGAYSEDGVWKRNGVELSPEEVNILETALLVEYDKLGGAIKRGDDKVKLGSFYDFKGRQPRETPRIEFTYRIEGKVVNVPDGVELPGIVKAAKILDEQKEIDEESQPRRRGRRSNK